MNYERVFKDCLVRPEHWRTWPMFDRRGRRRRRMLTGRPMLLLGPIAVIAAALAISAPARADPAMEPRTERVSYADLDLSAPAGRETLERRIRIAVKRVCRPDGSWSSIGVERRCRSAAMAGVQPQLAALYRRQAVILASITIPTPAGP